MANVKIKDITEKVNPSGEDLLVIHNVAEDNTRSVKIENILSPTVETSLPAGGIVADKDRVFILNQTGDISLGLDPAGSHAVNKQVTIKIQTNGNGVNTIGHTFAGIVLGGDDFDATKKNSTIIGYLNGVDSLTNQISDIPIVDVTPPTVSSFTIENSAPDEGVAVFSEAVNITNVTGLSLDGDLSGITFSSILSGNGTNTVTFQLSGSAINGNAGNFVYGVGNTIVDLADIPNGLITGSTAITNNVVDSLVINFDGTDLATYFDETDPNSIISESGGQLLIGSANTGSLINYGANRVVLKTGFRETLANGQKYVMELENVGWNTTSGAVNDNYAFGLRSVANSNYLIVVSPSGGQNFFVSSLLDGAFDELVGHGLTTVPSNSRVRFEYTRNSVTPASSNYKISYFNGAIMEVVVDANADLGDQVIPYFTLQDQASNTGLGAFLSRVTLIVE